MQVKRIKLFFEPPQPHSKLNQNKPFTSSVLSMWLTHVNEKSRIIFGPSQAPYKLNQNKSLSRQKKKPPMTQNIKENSQSFLPFVANI
jgi:hypothetical protein